MKFVVLVTLNEGVSGDVLQELGQAEARAVWESHKRGLLESMFHRADVPGAVAIMQADSQEAVQSELQKLPLYDHVDIQIIPIKPYEGYEALWVH